MKSIQTKLVFMISSIIIVVITAFLFTATIRTNAILNDDSQDILASVADYYANVIDDNFRSTEQSVGTIFNYANKRAETYTAFYRNEAERDHYTYDISELGKSIAENTRGAMAVYLRYNPDDYGPVSGFWYTINLSDNSWQPSDPTDMSLYDKNDLEHVGWYYIPVATGEPMWMDPYYNANLGVDMISYIIPYYYKGHTIGIIGMDISMDLLKESVASVTVYDSGRAFLIEKSGNVIYHEKYPNGTYLDSLPETDRQYFQNILKQSLSEPMVYSSIDGKQQKLILKELKNGMILGIYAPLEEINTPQRILQKQFLVISAIILIAATLIALMWVRTIIMPLKKMTNVAEHYANGDFSEEMSIQSKDEIGILSQSLQTMSSSLQEQITLADTANRAKSDFLANMSHEIRTPINTILGMNEMILHEAQEDEILEYSTNIQTAGKTLLSLINTILDFSKIEDGKMEILPANYSTTSMINNLVISILERSKAKGLDFIVDIDENLPSLLWGDDIRITQVIMNLLTNSVKYTEEGSVTFSVKEKQREGDQIDLEICVKDTGIGIREEDLGKLFESFERIEKKRNRNIEGTGLGMSIVYRLLNMMNTQLKVESTYGKGSKFSFVLRQKIVDSRPIGNYTERLNKSSARTEIEQNKQARGAKILVVDDNEMNLKVAKNLLKLSGIVPDLANSGADAIEQIEEHEYHIVFLDHMMPKMDGIETLQNLRQRNLLPKGCIVIALTANAIVGAKESYLAAGFDDYLSKPIELPKLEKLLDRYLPKELFEESGKTSGRRTSSTGRSETGEEGTGEDHTALLKTLTDKGLNTAAGLNYSAMDEDFYLDLLRSFAEDEPAKAALIRENNETKNLRDYQTHVHALKSTSKMIGADALSALALAQENAAKAEDTAAIDAGIEPLLLAYSDVCKIILDTLGAKKDPIHTGDEEIDTEDLKEQVQEVIELLRTFETMEAESILKSLSGLCYHGVPLKNPLQKSLSALDDFDTEKASDLLKEFLTSI